MIRRWLLLSAVLLSLIAPVSHAAGTLYTVGISNGHIALFTVDPVTGASALVVETDTTSILGPMSAIDEQGQRFFFRTPTDLYTIDIAQRTYSHVPSIGTELQFDPVARQLDTIGISNGHIAIFAVNPATGARTLIVETDTTSLSGPTSTFDDVNGRFFFRSATDLYTVNVRTGTYSHVPASGSELQYDSATGTLYTVGIQNGHIALFTQNPATGAMTLVVETDTTGIQGPESALDEQLGRFFFRDGTPSLYTINYRQGTFSHVSAIGTELQFAQAPAAVPALSTAMLVVLMAIVAAAAILRLR